MSRYFLRWIVGTLTLVLSKECSVSIMAIFYSSLMSCFPGMLRRHLRNDAPIITRISLVFTFHVRSISVIRSLHVISFWFIINMLIHLFFSFPFWLRIPIYIWPPLAIGVILLFKQTLSRLLFYSISLLMHHSLSWVTLTDQLGQHVSTHKTSPSGTPSYNYLSADEMDIYTFQSLK